MTPLPVLVARASRALACSLVLLFGLPAASLAQAESSGQTAMVVNTEATFLRDAPNVRAKVVTRLERGDRVEVLDRAAGDWWRVRAGDPPREGFVHRLVLLPQSEYVARQPARPASPPPAPEDAPAEAPATPDADVDATVPPVKRRGVGLLGSGGVGVFFPTARESFDAVGITGNPIAYSGSVDVVRIFKGLFVRGTFEWVSETGERAFLTESGERFPLGIPLDVEMQPIEATVGWRFEGRPSAKPSPLVPYVGGGFGVLRYRETDEFADAGDEVDESFGSYHVLAGLDVYVTRWLGVRGEYRFRAVPDSLGDGGVSAVTGDTSLGGSVLYVGVVVGR